MSGELVVDEGFPTEEETQGLLLKVTDLKTSFATPRGRVRAVDGVSLELGRGETLGIVGESGSGKTVLSRSIMGLLPRRTTTQSGSIVFDGTEIVGAEDKTLRTLWGAKIAMVFQDPMTSLNPVVRIERQITETLYVHKGLGRASPPPRSESATIPTSSRVGCARGSPSPSHWPVHPVCCSPTSRPPDST